MRLRASSGFLISVGEVAKSATSHSLMEKETFWSLGVDRMTETRCSNVSETLPRIQKVRDIFLYLRAVKISSLYNCPIVLIVL